MDSPHSPRGAPRRAFLRLLALAPAAAACATAGGGAKPAAGAAAEASPGAGLAPGSPSEPDPLAPIRSFPLPPAAEPAFVFRAAPARPRI